MGVVRVESTPTVYAGATLLIFVMVSGNFVGFDDCGSTLCASQTFTSFDHPNAIDTWANGINPARVITGIYLDASHLDNGFVRAADGSRTTFDTRTTRATLTAVLTAAPPP